MDEKLFVVEEVSEMLGVGQRAVRKLASQMRIGRRIGRKGVYTFTMDDVKTMVDRPVKWARTRDRESVEGLSS